jgi:mRNA interferase RelE/StbE
VSHYSVYITPGAWQEAKELPGHMRQRIKRAIDRLSENPRPAKSKVLDVPEISQELRRLRLDRWRIVYAITEEDNVIDVLAIRKRPPYDYGDLVTLIENIS